MLRRLHVFAMAWILGCGALAQAEPPFWGTIFIDPDIVTEEDPTSYRSLNYSGRSVRTMFDRRVNGWISRNAFLFDAQFDDGLRIEVQVNPEFESEAVSRAEALRFMHAIGQLPNALRRDVKTVWLHKGVEPFGGGNNNLLIHSGQADDYIRDGILEETLQHEASHTSLDASHAEAAGWLAAQAADSEFISVYARDNPLREDIAESFVPYFAVQHRRGRIDPAVAETISATISNRIAYFNSLNLDLYPAVGGELRIGNFKYNRQDGSLMISWLSRNARKYAVEKSGDLKVWEPVVNDLTGTGGEMQQQLAAGALQSPAFVRVRQD